MSYQIAIIGPGASRFGPILKRQLLERTRDLGSGLPRLLKFIYSRPRIGDPIDAKAPAVGVYFGGARILATDLAVIEDLVRVSAPLLPVVGDLSRFRRQVPVFLETD